MDKTGWEVAQSSESHVCLVCRMIDGKFLYHFELYNCGHMYRGNVEECKECQDKRWL